MSHYVLVHGAWEGAWGWEKVTPHLVKRGHTVDAVALPGSHENMQLVSDTTLESYIQVVSETIDRAKGKVILVAHSLGGATTSQGAERFPEKIERLVYVASFLVKDGESILEAMESDKEAQILPELILSEDQSYAKVGEATWRRVAFHDASEGAIGEALSRLSDKQSLQPLVSKLRLTQERFGSVPKHFIGGNLDRMTTPDLQKRMLKNWAVEKVDHLESGHFPMLSMPLEVAKLL
jgi:pimeloyl-ACP methyl ester carboxylesterase